MTEEEAMEVVVDRRIALQEAVRDLVTASLGEAQPINVTSNSLLHVLIQAGGHDTGELAVIFGALIRGVTNSLPPDAAATFFHMVLDEVTNGSGDAAPCTAYEQASGVH